MNIVDKFFREGQQYNSPEEVPENERPPWHPSNRVSFNVNFTIKTFDKKKSLPEIERELAFALQSLGNKINMEPTNIVITPG